MSGYFAENMAILKHEAETLMRGHDADGMCCLRARLAARYDESPAQPSEDD